MLLHGNYTFMLSLNGFTKILQVPFYHALDLYLNSNAFNTSVRVHVGGWGGGGAVSTCELETMHLYKFEGAS